MKAQISWIRRSQRVIRAVSELHRMGYQRLRIMPYEYPLAYRVHIAPASSFSPINGAYVPHQEEGALCYSSASEDRYFDWPNLTGATARQLAEAILGRRPDLVEAGRGRDWAYAGWLSELLAVMEANPGRLPIVMAEYFEPEPEQLRALPLRLYDSPDGVDHSADLEFPLPPPPPLER